jgi:hypothetical protein
VRGWRAQRAAPIALLVGALAAACGPRLIELPGGAGAPSDTAAAAFADATQACAGVRTLTAELGVSGRSGDRRLRGRLIAGFARPASMRLEGVAPFGAPAFILVAANGESTLLLPREDRVLQGERPAAILEALSGLPLAPDDLLAMLGGCLVPEPRPAAGRMYAGGWLAVAVDAEATAYLKREAAGWRIVAGLVGPLQIEYGEFAGAWPRRVRIVSAAPTRRGVPLDLTVRVSQVETNVALEPAAFSVDVPPTADPLTLDELRRAGPLAGPRPSSR